AIEVLPAGPVTETGALQRFGSPYFPSGSYFTSEPIVMTAAMRLHGDNFNSGIYFSPASSSGEKFLVQVSRSADPVAGGFSSELTTNVEIDHIGLNGPFDGSNSPGNASGILFAGGRMSAIRFVSVAGFGKRGIVMEERTCHVLIEGSVVI